VAHEAQSHAEAALLRAGPPHEGIFKHVQPCGRGKLEPDALALAGAGDTEAEGPLRVLVPACLDGVLQWLLEAEGEQERGKVEIGAGLSIWSFSIDLVLEEEVVLPVGDQPLQEEGHVDLDLFLLGEEQPLADVLEDVLEVLGCGCDAPDPLSRVHRAAVCRSIHLVQEQLELQVQDMAAVVQVMGQSRQNPAGICGDVEIGQGYVQSHGSIRMLLLSDLFPLLLEDVLDDGFPVVLPDLSEVEGKERRIILPLDRSAHARHAQRELREDEDQFHMLAYLHGLRRPEEHSGAADLRDLKAQGEVLDKEVLADRAQDEVELVVHPGKHFHERFGDVPEGL
jgi:hypothetical protein